MLRKKGQGKAVRSMSEWKISVNIDATIRMKASVNNDATKMGGSSR